MIAEDKYPINFTESGKRFVLSLHYDGSNRFRTYINSKEKKSKIKPYPLCLGNNSKDFTLNDMKKTGLKGSVRIFSFDYNAIDTNDILDTHRYLMKEAWYKIMLGFIKKMLIALLTSLVKASSHTKCVSLNNQQYTILCTLFNSYPNEYTQELCYYLFAVNLDGCVGSCNTLNDLSDNIYVVNETEDLNLRIFNMITGINESKILTKHKSCECKCKFDGRKHNSNQKWNNDKCWCECKNPKEHHICKKDYIWNPATCCCENGKYLASIFDDSIITCDEIIETTEIPPTNFNEKKVTCKTKNFYILLAFLSITIALLIAVSIYCCLKKYKAKQKHLLPYHVTNIKLKEVLYW